MGGTTLTRTGTGWSESAWSGAGSAYNDASLTLNRAGLVMGLENDVTVDCVSADVGRLTYQDPAAGRVVVKGTSVNFSFGVRPSGNAHCR